MRKTSQDRHPPRENVRSAHEGCVWDVSVDLSGMSPRVHTLSQGRGILMREILLPPGEGGRRPDEGPSEDSPVHDAAPRHHPHIEISEHDADQTRPRPEHVMLVEPRQRSPGAVAHAADRVGRETIDLASDQMPKRVT